jgi:hypothetical protein
MLSQEGYYSYEKFSRDGTVTLVDQDAEGDRYVARVEKLPVVELMRSCREVFY